MSRLFVALPLPEGLRRSLGLMAMGLPGGKSAAAGRLHLTLRFVGEVGSSEATALQDALAEVKAAPFTLTPRGVGCFPRRRDPRVVWAGFAESQELLGLHARVERAVTACGFEAEGRRFHAHVTVARPRGVRVARIADWLEEHALWSEEGFTIEEFRLYSSVLRPDGARHSVEARYELAE